jgi:hypothetical protein
MEADRTFGGLGGEIGNIVSKLQCHGVLRDLVRSAVIADAAGIGKRARDENRYQRTSR